VGGGVRPARVLETEGKTERPLENFELVHAKVAGALQKEKSMTKLRPGYGITVQQIGAAEVLHTRKFGAWGERRQGGGGGGEFTYLGEGVKRKNDTGCKKNERKMVHFLREEVKVNRG